MFFKKVLFWSESFMPRFTFCVCSCMITKYGYPGPCFQTHSTKIPDLWWQIMIKHSYFSCFHTHVLHVHQQRETQSFPTSFPCMWPSGTHLGEEVWNLGLDLVSAQHAFPRSFAYMRDLFESAFNRLCPVFVGLGLVSTPTWEETMWVVFLIKLCYTCFHKSRLALFWKVLDLAWMTILLVY